MVDAPYVRGRVSLLRSAAEDQVAAIECGKPRMNREFALWSVPLARAILNDLTGFEASPPEVAAHMLVGACDVLEILLDLVEARPEAAARLHGLMLETAALIYATTQTLAAPTPRLEATTTRLNRRSRRQRDGH